MNHSGFEYKGLVAQSAATGSHPSDIMALMAFTMIQKKKAIREKTNGIFWFNNFYSNQQGSTGLIGSSEDLSKFMIAMLNDGSYNGKQILSKENKNQMFQSFIEVNKSPAPKIKGLQFGYSWFIHHEDQQKIISHAGAGAAFVCQMKLFPKRNLGIAIMANGTYLGKDMGTDLLNQLSKINW